MCPGRVTKRGGNSGVSTLEKNESLTIGKSELVVEVDPMFHKTSSAFDEGGAGGLLLNQLAIGQHCRVVCHTVVLHALQVISIIDI